MNCPFRRSWNFLTSLSLSYLRVVKLQKPTLIKQKSGRKIWLLVPQKKGMQVLYEGTVPIRKSFLDRTALTRCKKRIPNDLPSSFPRCAASVSWRKKHFAMIKKFFK